MSVVERKMTLVEFLKLPETEPACEFIDGRSVPKVSPKARHSRLQGMLVQALDDHASAGQVGSAFPELRCTFSGRSYVFDISYFRSDRIAYGPDGELVDDVFLPPDLAVEILSPGQSPRSTELKLSWSVRHGVRMGWLIDPIRQKVRVFLRGSGATTLDPGGALEGADVLPGFRLK